MPIPRIDGASSSTQFNPYVISSIVLANGTQYTMRYNAYGELAQLTLPTGGYYTYIYSEAHCSTNGNASGVITLANNSGYRIWRPLRERDEYADGTHLSGKLMLGYPGGNMADPNHSSRPVSQVMADFEDAGGNILRKEMHFFYGDPASMQAPPSDPTTFAPWWEGLEYQTRIADGNYTVRQAVQQVYQQRTCTEGNCWFGDPNSDTAPSHDPQLCQTVSTLDSAASGVLYKYDDYNNVSDKWEYDYGAAPGIGAGCLAAAPGNYFRHTQTQYVGGVYLGSDINLLSLPDQVTVDVSGIVTAKTHYGYDELPLAPAPGIVGHDDAFGLGLTKRGNLTNPATCLNPANCTWMNHPRYYDVAGNMVSSSDAKNNTTQFGYNDDGQNKYAFVTSVTNALGHKTSFLYDYGAGRASWVVD